jgi:flagellar hook-associated protein 3 FlgL
MIDRVGTFNHSMVLLNEFQRIQSRITETQTQISSGKVGDSYADVDNRAGVLAAAKAKTARTETLMASAKEVQSRLGMQDVQLRQLGDLADQLREAIADAMSTGRAEGLMESARGIYKSAAALLNSQVDGVFIYGGTRTDIPPVNAKTLEELEALPVLSDAFANTNIQQTQTVEEGVTMQTGMLASDLGTALFGMLRDIAAMDVGVDGPFGSELNAAQTAFLEGQMAQIPGVTREINAFAAVNGVRYNQIEDVVARHEDTAIELKKFMGDIEDVDLAEAITRLNQDQAAQQAAARMIANLQDNSLLNYLN